MSKFTVAVQICHRKFTPIEITEEYADWQTADTAFCAYRELTKLKNSAVKTVELIEHREEIRHKAASKEATTEATVVDFEEWAKNGTNG